MSEHGLKGWTPQVHEGTTPLRKGLEELSQIKLKGVKGNDPLAPLREVYENYKHMNQLLSAPLSSEANFETHIARDLWQAIKQTLGEK